MGSKVRVKKDSGPIHYENSWEELREPTGVARTVFYADEVTGHPDGSGVIKFNPSFSMTKAVFKSDKEPHGFIDTGIELRDGAMYEVVISMLDGNLGSTSVTTGANTPCLGVWDLGSGGGSPTLAGCLLASNSAHKVGSTVNPSLTGVTNQFYTFRYQSHKSMVASDINAQANWHIMNFIAPMGNNVENTMIHQKIGNALTSSLSAMHVDTSGASVQRMELCLNTNFDRRRFALQEAVGPVPKTYRPRLVIMNHGYMPVSPPMPNCDVKLFVKITERFSDNPQD